MISVIGSAMIASSPIEQVEVEEVVARQELRRRDRSPKMITATSGDRRGRPPTAPAAAPSLLAGAQAPRCVLLLRSAAASRSEIPRSSVIAPSRSAPAIAWFQNGETPSTYRAREDRAAAGARRGPRRRRCRCRRRSPRRRRRPRRSPAARSPCRRSSRSCRTAPRRARRAAPASAAAEHEGGEDAPAARDAGEARGVGVRPDRVQLATRADTSAGSRRRRRSPPRPTIARIRDRRGPSSCEISMNEFGSELATT